MAGGVGESGYGVVVALHISPQRHAPMVARETVVVEAGAGIVGDRFHGTRHRHVSVQSEEALAEAADTLGRPVPAEGTRRAVTVRGLDVPTVPGTRLTVGPVELEVVRVAAPCRIMDDTLGPGGREALRRRGGSILRALSSGEISVGDPVRLLE